MAKASAAMPTATAAIAIALLVASCGSEPMQRNARVAQEPPPSDRATPPGAGDYSVSDCDSQFADYHLGSSFQSLPLTHTDSVCAAPEPERTQSSGNAVDPDSLGRVRFTETIYGTCKATAGTGCPPPLAVQVWPACERSPGDYTKGGEPFKPIQTTTLRGVPARWYPEGRLELSTGDVTVVIFGDSNELMLAAAQLLRTGPDSPRPVSADEPLPRPLVGAQEGTLPCR